MAITITEEDITAPASAAVERAMNPVVRRVTMVLIALVAVLGIALASPTSQASAAPLVPQSPAVISVFGAPQGNDWAAQTARFAGCLGGFGVAAVPIVVGFMFGGPGGAVNAAKAWFPRVGPAGSQTIKWCMRSIFNVRM